MMNKQAPQQQIHGTATTMNKLFHSNGYKSSHDSDIIAGDINKLMGCLKMNMDKKLSKKNKTSSVCHSFSIERLTTKQHGIDFGHVFGIVYKLPTELHKQRLIESMEMVGIRNWKTR